LINQKFLDHNYRTPHDYANTEKKKTDIRETPSAHGKLGTLTTLNIAPPKPHRIKSLMVGLCRLSQPSPQMSGMILAAPHVSGILVGFLSMRREFAGYPQKANQLMLANCTELERDRYIRVTEYQT
jgi:hypothetical protein